MRGADSSLRFETTVKVDGKYLSQVFDANKQRTEVSSMVTRVRPQFQFRDKSRTLARTTSSNEALVVIRKSKSSRYS